MIKSRIHHWTCSKFADLIRGEKKPLALEWVAWDDYYSDLKKRKPVRYWITEKFLKTLQDIVYYPYDIYSGIKYYIRNRWIDKTHYLKTGLTPGKYHEFDERILHGLFNELVDYVEIELAHLSLWDRSKKYKFKKGRCVEAAYDYFKWASRLKDTYPDGTKKTSEQAKTSRKIKRLYEWWTKTRPSRVDPYVSSGWNEACKYDNDKLFSLKNETPAEMKKINQALKKLHKIEEKYDTEDTNMLIELIKLRKHLWS